MSKTPNPKEVARSEVFKRIKTLEQAKEDFIKWIDQADFNGHTQDTINFWSEVKKETQKL